MTVELYKKNTNELFPWFFLPFQSSLDMCSGILHLQVFTFDFPWKSKFCISGKFVFSTSKLIRNYWEKFNITEGKIFLRISLFNSFFHHLYMYNLSLQLSIIKFTFMSKIINSTLSKFWNFWGTYLCCSKKFFVYLIFYSWQRVPKPPILWWPPPYVAYPLPFSNVVVPPIHFVLLYFFLAEWVIMPPLVMCYFVEWYYRPKLVPPWFLIPATCCAFYPKGMKVTESLTRMTRILLVLWCTQRQTQTG